MARVVERMINETPNAQIIGRGGRRRAGPVVPDSDLAASRRGTAQPLPRCGGRSHARPLPGQEHHDPPPFARARVAFALTLQAASRALAQAGTAPGITDEASGWRRKSWLPDRAT